MKLFVLNEHYECEVNKDEVYLIPDFKALFELKYNAGKGDHDGRLRRRAKAELTYMYFFAAYESELRHLNEKERHEAALHYADLQEDYTISDELEQAIKTYLELQETRMLKLIKSAYGAIDKTRGFFDELDYHEKTANGGLLYDPNKIMSIINNLGKTEEGLQKLEERVKLSLANDSKVRGDKEEGRIR